jgi:hypothetical protein
MTKFEWEAFVDRINQLADKAKIYEDPAATIEDIVKTPAFMGIQNILVDTNNGIAFIEPVRLPQKRKSRYEDDAYDGDTYDDDADAYTDASAHAGQKPKKIEYADARGLILGWDDERDRPRVYGVDELILIEDLQKALKTYIAEQRDSEFFEFFSHRLDNVPFGMKKWLVRTNKEQTRHTYEMRVSAKIGKFVRGLQREETGKSVDRILGNLSDEQYDALGNMFEKDGRVPKRETLNDYIRNYRMNLQPSLDEEGKDGDGPFKPNMRKAIKYADALKDAWERDPTSSEAFKRIREAEFQNIVETLCGLLLGDIRKNTNLDVLRAVTTCRFTLAMTGCKLFVLPRDNYNNARAVLLWHTRDEDAKSGISERELVKRDADSDYTEITVDPFEVNLYCNYPELFETLPACAMFATGRIEQQKDIAARLGQSEATVTNNVKIVKSVMRAVYEKRHESGLLSAYSH